MQTKAKRKLWWLSLTKEQQETWRSQKIAERKAKRQIAELDAEFRSIVG